jgi:RimJ/RimL family protein N-acetyltransferase
MVIPILETERLVLRALGAADFPAWAEMYADPEFASGLGHPEGIQAEDAWRALAMHIGHWTLRGFGMWAVAERSAPAKLIGRIGFHQPEGWPDFELGWAIAHPHWGRGYATEAARAALAHGFDVLRRARVISVIRPSNTRSVAVAKRLGERIVDRVELHGQDVDIWAIERDSGTIET